MYQHLSHSMNFHFWSKKIVEMTYPTQKVFGAQFLPILIAFQSASHTTYSNIKYIKGLRSIKTMIEMAKNNQIHTTDTSTGRQQKLYHVYNVTEYLLKELHKSIYHTNIFPHHHNYNHLYSKPYYYDTISNPLTKHI